MISPEDQAKNRKRLQEENNRSIVDGLGLRKPKPKRKPSVVKS